MTSASPLPAGDIEVLQSSFVAPEENIACDEALLDYCESQAEKENAPQPGALRFWESPVHFVALGYSKAVRLEVIESACAERGIPIIRRCTGGGTVLQGPGCYNYALVLPIASAGELESITATNRYIMERHRAALSKLLQQEVRIQGHTDLTLGDLKFSGNAQRRKRFCLLFHGSFLLKFDLPLIEHILQAPVQQPDYRCQRSHLEFVTNASVSPQQIQNAIRACWGGIHTAVPPAQELQERMHALIAEKYSREDWNRRF